MAELARAESFGGNSYPGCVRKMNDGESGGRTFTLECLVDLAHVAQRRFSLERESPVLDVLENVGPDGVVESGDPEDGDEVVDELSGHYFGQKVVAPVLDAYVCELGRGEHGGRGKRGHSRQGRGSARWGSCG